MTQAVASVPPASWPDLSPHAHVSTITHAHTHTRAHTRSDRFSVGGPWPVEHQPARRLSSAFPASGLGSPGAPLLEEDRPWRWEPWGPPRVAEWLVRSCRCSQHPASPDGRLQLGPRAPRHLHSAPALGPGGGTDGPESPVGQAGGWTPRCWQLPGPLLLLSSWWGASCVRPGHTGLTSWMMGTPAPTCHHNH